MDSLDGRFDGTETPTWLDAKLVYTLHRSHISTTPYEATNEKGESTVFQDSGALGGPLSASVYNRLSNYASRLMLSGRFEMIKWVKYLLACSAAMSIGLFLSGAAPKRVNASAEAESNQSDLHSETVRMVVTKRFLLPPGDGYEGRVAKDYSQVRPKFLMISVNSVTKTMFSDDDIAEFDCSVASRKCSVAFSLTAKHELIYTSQSDFAAFANIVAFYE
jgi:hypothetical protein